MFWNVTFIYNAFIRTTDHCKVQTACVSLFYIFINMKPWNASNSSVVVVGLLLIMLNCTLNANLLILLCYCYLSLGHLTNFCTNFYEFFNFGKIVKIREFFCCGGNEFSIYGATVKQVWHSPVTLVESESWMQTAPTTGRPAWYTPYGDSNSILKFRNFTIV